MIPFFCFVYLFVKLMFVSCAYNNILLLSSTVIMLSDAIVYAVQSNEVKEAGFTAHNLPVVHRIHNDIWSNSDGV